MFDNGDNRFLKKSIVLIGIMGAGKTTIGKALSSELGVKFFDTDREIERDCHCKVADIFYYAGEEYFRQAETKKVHYLLTEEQPSIISTGEGTYTLDEAREVIKEHAITVWIKADLDILLDRVSQSIDTRPLLENVDKKEMLEKLISERYPLYAQADIVVSTDRKSQRNTVREILDALEQIEVV